MTFTWVFYTTAKQPNRGGWNSPLLDTQNI